MAIPVSNSFVEGIFSLMGNIWTDERNRMGVELVKAELCIKINYNMTCSDFLEYLKKTEQKELLKCAMNNEKYSFKFK